MTNWQKIEPVLQALFPSMTAGNFAEALEDYMSILGGADYRCYECVMAGECAESDKACWQSILEWLNREAQS